MTLVPSSTMMKISDLTQGTHIPDDLIIEILSSLPTKSLRRFQCASKDWRGFISYVSRQRRILLPISGLFFYTYRESFSPSRGIYVPIGSDLRTHEEERRDFESRVSRLPFSSTYRVTHSCNGLLLLTQHKDTPSRYFVWNPATGESLAIPEPWDANWWKGKRHSNCFLAFDPHTSPHYKLVQFIYNDKICIAVIIYSSITGSWAKYTAPYNFEVWNPVSVYHKGALFMHSRRDALDCFHIKKRSFHRIKTPEFESEFRRLELIGESRGQLYFAVNTCAPNFELQIHMLDEKNFKKWILIHKISTNFLGDGILPHTTYKPSYHFRPIAFHPESEVIYMCIVHKILAFHPSSGRLEQVCRLTRYEGSVKWPMAFYVTPCLESLNPPGEKTYQHICS